MIKQRRVMLAAGLALVFILGTAYTIVWYRYSQDDCVDLADDPERWAYLESRWSEGGVVLVQRHATKCLNEGPDCPDGNEVLTDLGRLESRALGAGLREALGGSFEVRHSYLTRTHDTARLAFDHSTRSRALEKPCKETFNDHIREVETPGGGNLVLVTHSSCINALRGRNGRRLLGFNAGRSWNFGLSAFVERGADGHNEPIGCMRPLDWANMAGKLDPTIRESIARGIKRPPPIRF